MDMHKNAPLTPRGREDLVRRVILEKQAPGDVAAALGVCVRTVRKWVGRYRAQGPAGLVDRSSRPHCSPNQTPATTAARVGELRRRRWTGAQVARETGISRATVHRILRRLGLNRLTSLEPREPVRRYERDSPGELIHIDIKKLGRIERIGHRITGNRRDTTRGAGWEFAHVCIDDHSRVAHVAILPSERKEAAVSFLKTAVAYYARLGVAIERVMTDNGSCYRSIAFRKACKSLGLRHIRTRPYTPRTNGKAERFIQTALREWAYAQAYQHSDQRNAELPRWLHRYNWHRPHSSLKAQTPISRLAIAADNLSRLHS
jgi:transposase InsO family protein